MNFYGLQDRWIMKKVILISCVSKKRSISIEAKDLYISPLFKLNLKYATQINPSSIYILSAKHGLLNLEDQVDPYEQTLNRMKVNERRAWSKRVLEQLSHITSLQEDEFTFLAGSRYRQFLVPHLKHVKIPLEGLGIGYQLQKLKDWTGQ